MEIGILTFHYAHNYGAVLQAYALKAVLTNMGHTVHIINYRNTYIDDSYTKKLNTLSEIEKRGRHLDFKECLAEYFRRKKFNLFILKTLLDNNKEIQTLDTIEKMDMDIYITGSDQVWTWWLTGGYDPVYFLDFRSNAKKISYAASMYDCNILQDKVEYIKDAWKRFNYISVRESEIADYISSLCNIEVSVVADPTLLLNKSQYHVLEKKCKFPKNGVFVYYVTEDQVLKKFSVNYAEQLGTELYELHYVGYDKDKKYKQVSAISPGQFLYCMNKAKTVITNSYHGVIFSIIYRKNFYAVYEHDDRKDGLLRLLGLEEQHINSINVGCENMLEKVLHSCDYETVQKRLNGFRQKSIAFLNNAIKSKM